MCKHNWKILSEVKTESRLEQLRKADCNEINLRGSMLAEFTTKKLIQIVVCDNCGKLKRFVTDY